MTILIDNIETNYIDTGDSISGEAILFLHGWAAPISVYTSIFDHLTPKYRVIALDTPGCGKTGEPPRGFSVDDYCDFVMKFCKEIGVYPRILMGHSFGVRLMIKLLGDRGIDCEKAVVIDGAGIVPKRPASYYFKVYSYKIAKKIVATKVGNYFFGPLYEERSKNAGSSDYASASPVMKHTFSLVVNEDLKHIMPKVSTNTLLIWGEKDLDTPLSYGKTMEKLMANAGLAVIEAAGHYPFLDNPTVFFRILDSFL